MALLEANDLAAVGEQHDVARTIGDGCSDQGIAFFETQRDKAVAAGTAELHQRCFLHGAARGGHKDVGAGRLIAVVIVAIFSISVIGLDLNSLAFDHTVFIIQLFAFLGTLLLQRFQINLQHRGNPLALFQRQQIHQRTAARGARSLRNFVGFQPVNLTAAGEQQQRGMTVGNQQVLNVVFIFHTGRRLTATTTALSLVIGQRLALGIATVGNGHHALFFGNQISDGQIHARRNDLGTTLVAEGFLDLLQLFNDDFHQTFMAVENAQQLTNLFQNLLILGEQFFVFQTGQAMQAHVENRLGLFGRQVVLTIAQAEFLTEPVRAAGFGTRTFDHFDHRARRPGSRQQALLGFGRGRRLLDQLDHRINVGQRNRLTFEDVTALTGLAQLIHGTAGNHLAAVAYEGFQQLLEVQDLRLAIEQADHVDAENTLHLGLGIKVVEYHLGHFAPAQLDYHADTVLVRLIAQLGNTLKLLLFYQFGDLLDQTRLVELVGQFGNHDLLATANLVDIFDMAASTDVNATAPGTVGLNDARTTIDDTGGREVRPRNELHQLVDADIGIADHRQTAVDHFGQVVRRDIGRHTDGDTTGTVDQQVRNLGRQDVWNLLLAVVVGYPVDGFLVQIGQQFMGQLGHPHFGVTHCCRVIAINGTEVALTVDQRIAHGKVLRHTHDSVVYGRVTVRVVLTDHVTNNTGRLQVRLVPVVAQFAHRVQHATVHRLEAIAHVRQCPSDNYAHRIIQIGLLQFVFDIDWKDLFGQFTHETAFLLLSATH